MHRDAGPAPEPPPGTVDRRSFGSLLALLGLVGTLPVLIRFYRYAGNGLDVAGYPVGRDFINVWVGAKLAFQGQVANLFAFDAYAAAVARHYGAALPDYVWSYPPQTLVLLWPLAGLPYVWALTAWTVVLSAAFAAVTLSQVSGPERPRALLLILIAPACLINAASGQNGLLTGVLLLGGLLLLDRRPWLSGLLLGLLSFKPQLGLVLPFVLLARGAWRTIAAACLTAMVFAAVSVALFGLEPWRAYVTVVSPRQLAILERFDGFFACMMTSVYAGARSFGLPSRAAWALQAAVALPVLVGTVLAVRRDADPVRRASVVVCAVPLLTPYAFNYDLTAVAAVIVWRLAAPIPAASGPRLLAAWLIPAVTMPLAMLGVGLAPVALLALWLTVRGETGDAASAVRGPAAAAA